ncbi:MAG: acyl carrier protein [Beijerinckiaceae bacterium]
MPENVAEAVRTIIAQHLDRPPGMLTPDMLLDELGVSSLQLVEIIMDLEDMFDIEIAENTSEAWARLKTVADVTQAVEAMIAKKA